MCKNNFLSQYNKDSNKKQLKNFCSQLKNSKCLLDSKRVCSLPAQTSQRCVSDPGPALVHSARLQGAAVVVTPFWGFGREELGVSPESLGSQSQDERAPPWACSETRARLTEEPGPTLAALSPLQATRDCTGTTSRVCVS